MQYIDQFRDIRKTRLQPFLNFVLKGTSRETFLGFPCGTIDQEKLEWPLCKNS
jgi:hypothetical protein